MKRPLTLVAQRQEPFTFPQELSPPKLSHFLRYQRSEYIVHDFYTIQTAVSSQDHLTLLLL